MNAAPGAPSPADAAQLPTPGIMRRIAAMLYEFVLLFGVLFVSVYAFVTLGQAMSESLQRPLLQLYVLIVLGAYFCWFWLHGGQTLPAKTWNMRVVAKDGGKLTLAQAIARYLLALVLMSCFGVTILWALFDRDRQFLHDRLAGTRIIDTEPGKPLTTENTEYAEKKQES